MSIDTSICLSDSAAKITLAGIGTFLNGPEQVSLSALIHHTPARVLPNREGMHLRIEFKTNSLVLQNTESRLARPVKSLFRVWAFLPITLHCPTLPLGVGNSELVFQPR